MARFANSVQFTPVSTGTVDFVVSAAVSGFMTPALAGMPSGTYKYRAESNDLSQWEIGEGTYTSGTTTLTRTTVLYNSAGTGTASGQSGAGTKINFTAAPNVGVVQLVADTLEIDNTGSFTAAQRTQARSNISAVLRGHLSGMSITTTSSSSTFSVTEGQCADSTAVDLMVLAAFSKTTGAWAVGSGNGSLDTGTIAVGSWYHVFIIKRPDTGVVDVLVSLSATAPTLPANYTLFRRIGSLYCNTGSVWYHRVQYGDLVLYATPIMVYDGDTTVGTTATLKVTFSPTGIVIQAYFSFVFQGSNALTGVMITPPSVTWSGTSPNPSWTGFANATTDYFVRDIYTFTDTSAQIKIAFSFASTNTFYLVSKGYIDRRGQDD